MISHYVKDMLGLKPLSYCSNFSGACTAVQVAKKRNFYLQKRSYLFRLWKLLLCVDNADFCQQSCGLVKALCITLQKLKECCGERCLLKKAKMRKIVIVTQQMLRDFPFVLSLSLFLHFLCLLLCPKEWHRPRRRNGPLELSLVVCRQSFRQNCA